MDLIGPLPRITKENQYILTIIDHFSRWCYASPLKSKSAARVLEVVKTIIKTKNEKPKTILTDNGLEFVNKEFSFYAENENIVLKRGSPYHQQTTGSLERLNQTLMNKLKRLCNFGMIEWGLKLKKAVLAYNISFSRVARFLRTIRFLRTK